MMRQDYETAQTPYVVENKKGERMSIRSYQLLQAELSSQTMLSMIVAVSRALPLVALGCTFINTNYPFHIIQLSVVFFQKRGC